jgi:hypothetical protein
MTTIAFVAGLCLLVRQDPEQKNAPIAVLAVGGRRCC